MSIQVQPRHFVKKRLAKKPRKAATFEVVEVLAISDVLKGRSAAISHSRLRDRTLRHHLGKFSKPSTGNSAKHSVELTDDVIVIGRDGRRVSAPTYATLRIDQLPQFRKS